MTTKRSGDPPEAGSARQVLMFHWAAFYLEELLRLSAIPPLNSQAGNAPEHTRELEEHLEAVNLHVARSRRIASYLGHELPPGHEIPEYKPNLLSALDAARLISVFLQNGESAGTIALFLEMWRKPGKPGRPKGSNNPDGLALRALELYDSDPERWTWPKVADELCEHRKRHTPHEWNSPCTESLRQSVERLRKFLRELEASKATRRKQHHP